MMGRAYSTIIAHYIERRWPCLMTGRSNRISHNSIPVFSVFMKGFPMKISPDTEVRMITFKQGKMNEVTDISMSQTFFKDKVVRCIDDLKNRKLEAVEVFHFPQRPSLGKFKIRVGCGNGSNHPDVASATIEKMGKALKKGKVVVLLPKTGRRHDDNGHERRGSPPFSGK